MTALKVRATKLGQLSPVGRFFYFGQIFLKNTEVAQIFGHFSHGKSFVKNRLGLNLGYFFTNSSGHPAYSPHDT
jgi:hypothetical protein